MADNNGEIDFQLKQIIGSLGLEGVVLSKHQKMLIKDILKGTITTKEAKKALLKRYKK